MLEAARLLVNAFVALRTRLSQNHPCLIADSAKLPTITASKFLLIQDFCTLFLFSGVSALATLVGRALS